MAKTKTGGIVKKGVLTDEQKLALKERAANTAQCVLTPTETETLVSMGGEMYSRHVVAAGLVRAALAANLSPVLPAPKLTSKAAKDARIAELEAKLSALSGNRLGSVG